MLRTASPPSATIFDFRPVLFHTAQGRSRRNTLLTLHAQSDGGIISICRRRPPVFSKPSSDSIEFVPVSSHPDDTGSTVKQDLERDLYPETMVCEEDFSITVLKVEGRKNRRRIRSRVQVDADLSSVWRVLTDYEGLATFISGLAVSQLLERKQNFAKLYQVGEQNLALGLKFHAKGVIECCEGELEDTPMARRREIEFRMVEGDFQTFEGRWSIEQIVGETSEAEDCLNAKEYRNRTTLSYDVELEPKLWLPVGLLEGRVCREIKINLQCIRDEAQRIHKFGSQLLTS